MDQVSSSDLALGAAASFLFGIVAASLGWNPLFYLGLPLAVITTLCCFLSNRGKYWNWKLILILGACVFLGAFYYHLRGVLTEHGQEIVFDKTTSFSGVVVNEPAASEKSQSFLINLKPPFSGKMRIITDPLAPFAYGDLVSGEGKIERADSRAGNPVAFFPNIQIIGQHQGFLLKEKLIDFKHHLIGQFRRALPRDEAALAAGITFGDRSGFSKEFKNQMALSGTTHLVALSGYNISIVVLAAGFLFGYFFSRRLTFFCTLVTILLFVLMVGAEASVVRAAIMGFLILLARESSRMHNMSNAITLAALVMALADPAVLAYNIGFQLSFLSLLGIVYLEPALKRIFRVKKTKGLVGAAFTTASAQLAVFPLLSLSFGQFSPVAILSNILIIGLTPLTMAFGFILVGLSAIHFYLGFVVAKLLYLLLSYQIFVIKFFASHAWPVSLGHSLSIVGLYYAVLVFIVYEQKKHR